MSAEESIDSGKENEKSENSEKESKGSRKSSEKESDHSDKESEDSESKKDDKSEKDEKEQEEEAEIIEFSTLSKEEKIKYFNFFIANNTVFEHEPQGTWICEIDIIDEDKNKKNDIFQPNQNLRQSTFRTTKKDYDAIYNKLINVINPSPGIKGTKMNINVLRYMIQEIYGLKFYKDTQALFNKKRSEPETFPHFVGNFLINKFSKKETLDKKSVDFMLSLDYFGRNHKDIKVFQQFLTEEYDTDDLIFYLFVRSNIEKTLKVSFVDRAKENLNQNILYEEEGDDDIIVPVDKYKKLAKAIFGSEKDLQRTFLQNLSQLLQSDAADKKKKTLKANSILNMALRNYHDSRSAGGVVREEEEDDNEPEPPKQVEKEDDDEDEEDEERPKKKLRSAKKSNLKTSNSAKKTTNNPVKNTPKNQPKSNTIRVPKTTVNVKPRTTATTKTNQNRINNNSSRTNTTVNTSNKTSKTNTAVKQNPVRKASAERRVPERAPVRNTGSSSVGKRTNSANKRTGMGKVDESEYQDFKKILAKNKVERVKTEKEKVEYLKNVISDYFRYKEIDKFFRKMIDSNPVFKGVSSKINKNVKNTKEFSLRKLNAINALVACGDKNAFYNFMKIKEKDKVNRNYFEIMKKSFNSLVKGGPLKNMAEIEISNYCRIVLDFPEFSIQVSKDLLKYCE